MLLVEKPHLYKNEWPWRVMPCNAAQAEGFFDKGFRSKKQALAYQKMVKQRFPDEPCALVFMGRYFDALGRTYVSRD